MKGGSSWVGFWKIQPRSKAWKSYRDKLISTASGYARSARETGIVFDADHWNRRVVFANSKFEAARSMEIAENRERFDDYDKLAHIVRNEAIERRMDLRGPGEY